MWRRKHTLWQATSDFTGGQATICRRHFLQCPHGLLNRHYEKLIQCDPRLNLLTKKAFLSESSPCFKSKSAVVQDRDEQSCYGKSQENGSHVLTQSNHLMEEIYSTHLQREWRYANEEVVAQSFSMKELGLGLGIVLYE